MTGHDEAWLEELRHDIHKLPTEYTEFRTAVIRIEEIFLKEIGTIVKVHIVRVLSNEPSDTRQQRTELIRWANAELRDLRLQFVDPVTDLPAILVADTQRKLPVAFRLRLRVSEGTRRVTRTLESPSELLKLPLVAAPPRRESFRNPTSRKAGDSRGR
ncbi:MAG: hypothetical protein AAGJ54_08260 [Planctomycetota bacterium]